MAPTNNNVIYRGYTDSSPYPPIKVVSYIKQYADILMDDFAGPKGEFSAMNLYFYQHYIASPESEDYGIMVMRIAIAEMHHLKILSEVIRQLGGNPVFCSGSDLGGKYCTARNIVYSHDLCKSLQVALEGETGAIESYEKHIKMIEDPFIKSILERIIVDEKLHKAYINQMISTHCK